MRICIRVYSKVERRSTLPVEVSNHFDSSFKSYSRKTVVTATVAMHCSHGNYLDIMYLCILSEQTKQPQQQQQQQVI